MTAGYGSVSRSNRSIVGIENISIGVLKREKEKKEKKKDNPYQLH